MDFREHTKKKLDDILKFGLVRLSSQSSLSLYSSFLLLKFIHFPVFCY